MATTGWWLWRPSSARPSARSGWMCSTPTGRSGCRVFCPRPAIRWTQRGSAAPSSRLPWRAGSILISGGDASERLRAGAGPGGTRAQVEGKAGQGVGPKRTGSAFAVDDPPLGEIVRSDLDGHPVAGDDPDEILAHLAGNVGEDAVTIFQLDHELGVGKRLDDPSFGSDRFFFGHADLLWRAAPARRGAGRNAEFNVLSAGFDLARSAGRQRGKEASRLASGPAWDRLAPTRRRLKYVTRSDQD